MPQAGPDICRLKPTDPKPHDHGLAEPVPASGSSSVRMLSAIGWVGFAQGARQGFAFLVTIVLLRALRPEDFGLMAIVLAVTGYAELLVTLGFAQAVVQRRQLAEIDVSSAFWTTLAAGAVLTAVALLAAPAVAEFFRAPQLRILLQAVSVNFMFVGASTVHRALLLRRLDYKILALIDTATVILAGGTAITLAVAGLGVWSLVAQAVLKAIMPAAVLWIRSSWRPRLQFSFESARSMAKLGGSILANRTIGYFAGTSDTFIIGRVMEEWVLGLYNRAFTLAALPRGTISAVLSNVLFPAFSGMQGEKEEIARVYLTVVRVVAHLVFPPMLWLAVSAELITVVLFGDAWRMMTPFLNLFGVLGMFMSINALAGTVLVSQGQSRLVVLDASFKKSAMVAGIVGGAWWGALGIAFGRTIAELFNLAITFRHVNKAIPLSQMAQARALLRPFLVASVSALALTAFVGRVEGALANPLALLCGWMIALLVHLGLMRLLERGFLGELRSVLALRLERRQ